MTGTSPADADLRAAISRAFGEAPQRLERLDQARGEGAWQLSVEFQRDGRRLQVVVSTREGQAHAMARGSLLSMSYRGAPDAIDIAWLGSREGALSGPEAETLAQAAATFLTANLPAADGPWEERPGEPLPRSERYLEPLLTAHAAHFGARPHALFHKQLTGAICLRYPQVRTHNQFFPRPGRRATQPGALSDYLRALGYATDTDGLIRTVPTPQTFARCCAELGLEPAFAPKMVSHPGIRFQRLHWLQLLTDGGIPINFAGERLYRVFQLVRAARLNRAYVVEDALASHLSALGHDMSTHVLALHRIPLHHALDICSRVRSALPTRRAAWRVSVAPITDFFEEDLTLECWKIWREISNPAEFEVEFEARSAAILELLDARIATSQSHLGWKNWWT